MMEGFEALKEGIVYGMVEEVLPNEIVLDIKGQKVKYKLRLEKLNVDKGDFIRAYVKDNEILYVEKLDEKLYKKFMKLFGKIKELD